MTLLPLAGSATVMEKSDGLAPLYHPAATLVAVGVDHTAAPIAVRERVVLLGDRLEDAHRDLMGNASVDEAAILSTCNRTELYLSASEPELASEFARTYLVACDDAVRPYVREWRGMDAAEHLLRVGAGLESRVLGDRQILSQVREALAEAKRLSTMGPQLHQLFRSSITCGRDVRRMTGLGQVDASIAVETVRAVELVAGPLQQRTALIVGGGEVSRLTAAELRCRGIGRLYLANRTLSVAEDLAKRFGGIAIQLADVGLQLPCIDVLISATSAPGRVLAPDDLNGAHVESRRGPLHVFDLAVPRDIDPAIGEIPGIILHDLDTLTPVWIRERHAEDIRAAELIVQAHLHELERWYRIRRAAPLIAELRRQLDDLAASELERASRRLAGLGAEDRVAVESLTARLTDAIFHRFVTRLRIAACASDERLSEAAQFFFGSDTDDSEEPSPNGERRMECAVGASGVER